MKCALLPLLLLVLPIVAPDCAGAETVTAIVLRPTTVHRAPATILSKLQTQLGAPFCQQRFDADLKTLDRDYADIRPHFHRNNGTLSIQLEMVPRPPLRTIRLLGNRALNDQTLSKELAIRSKESFHPQRCQAAIVRLRNLYRRQGYFAAAVDYQAHSSDDSVDLEITIREGPRGIIAQLIFDGVDDKEQAALRRLLDARIYRLWSRLTGGGIYHQQRLAADQQRIVAFLRDRGYADARVTAGIARGHGGVIITFAIDKGPLFHCAPPTFSGNKIFTSQQLAAHIASGDRYSAAAISNSIACLRHLYGSRGYLTATISAEEIFAHDQPSCNLAFAITEGEPCTVGAVRISGNTHTSDNVILRESTFVSGAVFDASQLAALEARLQRLGHFETVSVTSVPAGSNQHDVDIVVEEKGKSAALSLELGMGQEQQASGNVSLTETNWNSRGIWQLWHGKWPRLRGGGEALRAQLQLEAGQLNYQLSWQDPRFCDTHWQLGATLRRGYHPLPAYEGLRMEGISGHLSYPLANHWVIGGKYRIHYNRVDLAPEMLPAQRAALQQAQGVIAGVRISCSHQTTDHPLRPRRGMLATWAMEPTKQATAPPFLQLSAEHTVYWPPARRGVFKWRGHAHCICPLQEGAAVPLSERLYLGGADSVRGYKPHSIGPRFANNAPQGGLSSLLLSAEYQQQITRQLQGFLFLDGGSVSAQSWGYGSLHTSYGLGIRLEVLSGLPLTLGIGMPINPSSPEQVQSLFFSFALT